MVPSLPCVTFLSLLPTQNASGRQSGSRELPARPSFISNTPHRCIRERECPKGVASSSHESTCHGEGYCCEENNQLSYCLLGWLLVILFPLSWKKDKCVKDYFLLELFVQLLSKSIKTNQSHRNLHFVRLMAVTVEDSVRIGENSEKKKSLDRRFLLYFYGVSEREKKCLIIMIFTATIRHHFHHVTIFFIQQ